MNKRIEIGTLFLLFGLALLSTESGQAQIGAISYTVNPAFLKGFSVVAFGVSGLYCLSLLLWLTKRSWLTRCENFLLSHFPKFLIYPALTVYFSALFIVFTQGLIMGITRLPWENFRLPLLVFGLVWIAFIGVSHIGRAYGLAKFQRQNRIGSSGKSNWLREIVLNEVDRRRPPMLFSERLRQLSVPNLKTILYIVLALALSLLLSWILSFAAPGLIFIRTEGALRDFYLTMWQVQGAIAAVALPLLIVVIQFSGDLRQAATRRPEALIQDTWVFPIIAFALVGTARLGMDIAWFFTESVFWADFSLVFLATLSLTVLAYVRMLSILLSPLRMKKSSMRVVRNKMNSQLDQTIEERVANMILFRKLEELGVEYWPSLPVPEEEEQYIILRTSAIGVLRNIHMGKLGIFINSLPWKEPGLASFGVSEIETGKGKSLRESLPKRYIWWMKRYGQSITSQNNGLLRLDKSVFRISNPGSLEAQLGELVEVAKKDDGYELRLELSYLRDGLMDAIKDCKTGAVQDGLQIYEELVATFLDKLQQWGSTYRRHQAIRTSTSLEGGWFEIRWITDDLQEIIDMAMQAEYVSVIREVLHFPIHLASLAFLHKDYYIFHQFIDWVPYYYMTGLKLRDSRARDFVVGRCSMYLAETARYPIISSVEHAMTEEDVEVGAEFAKGIVLTFNRLLKSSYDEGEIEHFKDFSATVHSVFESYFRHNQEHELHNLEHQLKNPSLTDVQRSRVEQRLSLKRRQV